MEEWNSSRPLQTVHGGSERDVKRPADNRRQREERRKEAIERVLDRALEDTFPASDPVAVTQPPGNVYDKRAL